MRELFSARDTTAEEWHRDAWAENKTLGIEFDTAGGGQGASAAQILIESEQGAEFPRLLLVGAFYVFFVRSTFLSVINFYISWTTDKHG